VHVTRVLAGAVSLAAVLTFSASNGSPDVGSGELARTASSCAANAIPRNSATDERLAHSSSAKIPVNGP